MIFSLVVLANFAVFAWFYPAHYNSVNSDSMPRIEAVDVGVKLQLVSEVPRSFFRSARKPQIESAVVTGADEPGEAVAVDIVDDDVFLR